MNTTHRATYRRRGHTWEGVVKDSAGEIVAVCGHTHRNRDQSSKFSGKSARSCADDLLREVDPESWEFSRPEWMRRRY